MATNEKKRKRGGKFSRHRKAGWKNADVADIEEDIEDRRERERLGFDSSQVFFTDDLAAKSGAEPVSLGVKAKKRKLANEISTDSVLQGVKLRCFASFEPQSAIPALPSLPRTWASVEPERKFDRLVSKRGPLRKANGRGKSDEKTGLYDMWSDDVQSSQSKVTGRESGKSLESAAKGQLSADSKATNQEKKSAKSLKKRGMELPHAGQSYNPNLTDHALLLEEALKCEKLKLIKEAKLQRALKAPKVTNSGKADEEVKLASGESEGEEDQKEQTQPGRSTKESSRKKRTQEQKARRARDQLVREAKHRFEKERKRISAQATRVDAIKKELDRSEREHSKKKIEAAKNKTTKLPKLGPLRYEEDDLAIKLSDELGNDADAASLRRLRPEGNLLRERFRSLQKRGIVEVRHRTVMKRKYAPKIYERKSTENILSQRIAAAAQPGRI